VAPPIRLCSPRWLLITALAVFADPAATGLRRFHLVAPCGHRAGLADAEFPGGTAGQQPLVEPGSWWFETAYLERSIRATRKCLRP